jgi:hypothetical protein
MPWINQQKQIVIYEAEDTSNHKDGDSHLFLAIGGSGVTLPLDPEKQQQARELSLDYYYTNFIYHRMIEILADFVVSANFTFTIQPEQKAGKSQQVMEEFWTGHPNKISESLRKWILELLDTGELLWVFDVNNISGKTYVTTVGSTAILEVTPQKSDYRKPGKVVVSTESGTNKEYELLRYDAVVDKIIGNSFYLSLNNIGDMLRGVPYLCSALDWVAELQAYLFAKMRGSAFKDSVWIDVNLMGKSETDIKKFLADRSRQPPPPNSLIAHNERATWSVLSSSSTSAGSSEVSEFFLQLALNCAALTMDIFTGSPARNISESTNAGIKAIENVQLYLASCFETILTFVIQNSVDKGAIGKRKYVVKCNTQKLGIKDIQRVAGAVARLLDAYGRALQSGIISDEEVKPIIGMLNTMIMDES